MDYVKHLVKVRENDSNSRRDGKNIWRADPRGSALHVADMVLNQHIGGER